MSYFVAAILFGLFSYLFHRRRLAMLERAAQRENETIANSEKLVAQAMMIDVIGTATFSTILLLSSLAALIS